MEIIFQLNNCRLEFERKEYHKQKSRSDEREIDYKETSISYFFAFSHCLCLENCCYKVVAQTYNRVLSNMADFMPFTVPSISNNIGKAVYKIDLQATFRHR